ncbi:MAG: IS66 family insertion sequence element accessory protein TnpA [Planctomycetota bacterium]
MAALLARRERDGLSLRAFSEETGIPFGTLSWWSWRLRQDSSGESGGSGFVEVVASGRSARDAVVVVTVA